MVHVCVTIGCTNCSSHAEKNRVFGNPKLNKALRQQTKELSKLGKMLWLSNINTANFNQDPTKRHLEVCYEHFWFADVVMFYQCTLDDRSDFRCYNFIFFTDVRIYNHTVTSISHNTAFMAIPSYDINRPK